MKQLLISSRNAHKIAEIRAILGRPGLEILSAADVPDLPDVEEDGDTFADNGVAPESGLTVGASAVDATLGAATVTMANSIVWSPACATGLAPGSASVTYCCYAAATEGANGNTARNPLLRQREPGRYTFGVDSPCRNSGSNEAFGALTDAVDLANNRRLFGKRIDMGCYELQMVGTMLLLKSTTE